LKRVQLIVTGEMERCALHTSLRAMFPGAEFLLPHKADSFTSSRLTSAPLPPPRLGLPTKPVVNKLANTLISYIEPGSQRAGYVDLVLVVDDLELANHDQPGVVAEEVSRNRVSCHDSVGLGIFPNAPREAMDEEQISIGAFGKMPKSAEAKKIDKPIGM
jgi:hypothetical protein